MTWELLVIIGIAAYAVWAWFRVRASDARRNRWLRTQYGPGLGWTAEQTEQEIERLNTIDGESWARYQGKP